MNDPGEKSPSPGAWFVGDVCLSEGSAAAWSDPSRPGLFDGLRASVSDASILVGNVEGTFTDRDRPTPGKYAVFKADPGLVRVLRGLDVALLANNHMGDYGPEGAEETIGHLRAAGIACVGYGRLGENGTASVVVRRHGLALGVVNLCCPSANPAALATRESPGVAPLSLDVLKTEIGKCRAEADLVVFCPHWGLELTAVPVPEQIWIARQAIDWGADAVIGNHAHVIQYGETYRGRAIYYGLGNFIYPAGDWLSTETGQSVTRKTYRMSEAERISLAVALTPKPDARKVEDAAIRIRFGEDHVPAVAGPAGTSRDLRKPGTWRILRAAWLRWSCGGNPQVDYFAAWSGGRVRYWYGSARPGPCLPVKWMVAIWHFFRHAVRK